MPRYKLTIAYDGTDFHGWQKQELLVPKGAQAEDVLPGGGSSVRYERIGDVLLLRTVQQVVERAVGEVVREPVRVMGASRTDSGVHARGQVAAFDTSDGEERGRGWPVERGTEPMVRAINSRLPGDVLVLGADITSETFDPVTACVAKGYSYTLHVSPTRPLWDRRFVQHIWHALDVARMREVAEAFVGEHDFAAFAAAGHGRQTTVRRIFSCDVIESPVESPRESWEKRVRIEISGNGFLWNMVRIIAGTLVEAGRGKITGENVRQALREGERRLAGPTLPPTGLCLEWVRYD